MYSAKLIVVLLNCMIETLFIISAYLIGSLSTAIIICKLWGLPDPRAEGSQNPGATNVLRIGGKIPALLTLLGDGLKGFAPTLFAAQIGMDGWSLAGVMVGVFCGHIFPVFFKFRGGKGVATSLGAYLGLNWQVGILVISVWALVIFISKYSSLGAIVSALLAPLVGYLLLGSMEVSIGMAVISTILLLRHRHNVIRLLQGRENKV